MQHDIEKVFLLRKEQHQMLYKHRIVHAVEALDSEISARNTTQSLELEDMEEARWRRELAGGKQAPGLMILKPPRILLYYDKAPRIQSIW